MCGRSTQRSAPSSPRAAPASRSCSCPRSRRRVGSRSAASTWSSATGRACRSTRPSTPATGRSPTRAPTWPCGPMSGAPANWRSPTLPICAADAGEVAAALAAAAARSRPAAVVPDAETAADLEEIAAGLRAAEADGVAVIVRCAPAFAAVLTGAGALAPAEPPSGRSRTLVVCGSFMPGSTAQLEELARAHPDALVTAHVAALAGSAGRRGRTRLGRSGRADRPPTASRRLRPTRERDPAARRPRRAAADRAGARAGRAARVPAGVVLAKGGITAAVTARDGLGARGGPRGRAARRPASRCGGSSTGRRTWSSPGTSAAPSSLVDVVAVCAKRR